MTEASRSSVQPPRRRPGRSAVPSDVAPGVDPAWADAFLLELRLRDVPGRHIGDALAEVASHCAESGESAEEAFGDPVAYGRSLGLPAGPEPTASLPGSAIPWALQALALLLLAGAVPALAAGEPFTVTTGHLVAVVLLVGPVVALGRWGSAVLGFVVRHPVITWLAGMAHVGLLVVALLLFEAVVWRVPGPVAVGVSGAALVVTTGWLLTVLHREDFAEDPVTAPLADSRPRGGRVTAVVRYGPALLAPVVGVLLTAMTVLVQ
jgi:hypothetical protein